MYTSHHLAEHELIKVSISMGYNLPAQIKPIFFAQEKKEKVKTLKKYWVLTEDARQSDPI